MNNPNEYTGMVVSLIVLILLLVFAWLMSRRPSRAKQTQFETEERIPTARPEPAAVPATQSAVEKPDDLTRIEGIGPKTQEAFNAAGIRTFSALAATPAEKLQAILDEAGLKLGNPGTWPEQAALAAKGDWTRLEELSENLKGGRRV